MDVRRLIARLGQLVGREGRQRTRTKGHAGGSALGTTWLIQNVQEDEQTVAEYRRCIDALRNDNATRDWRSCQLRFQECGLSPALRA